MKSRGAYGAGTPFRHRCPLRNTEGMRKMRSSRRAMALLLLAALLLPGCIVAPSENAAAATQSLHAQVPRDARMQDLPATRMPCAANSFSVRTSAAASTQAAQEGYVNAKSLNMRAEPDQKSAVVKKYKKGQAVEIVGESGDWYEVVVAGATGYMRKEYVSLARASTQAEKSSAQAAAKTEAPQEAPEKTGKPERSETPAEQPATKASGGKYVGSSKQDKFHKPTCRFAKKILPENEVWWSSREDAVAAGRKACKVCKP